MATRPEDLVPPSKPSEPLKTSFGDLLRHRPEMTSTDAEAEIAAHVRQLARRTREQHNKREGDAE